MFRLIACVNALTVTPLVLNIYKFKYMLNMYLFVLYISSIVLYYIYYIKHLKLKS